MGELSINVPLAEGEDAGFKPYNIGDYTINEPLTSNKSGFSKWGFCHKDGHEYFIKEFFTPVYPSEDIVLSGEIRWKKISQCIDWFYKKKHIYQQITISQTGNLVPPIAFFRHRSHFYLVTEKVTETSADCKKISLLDNEHKLILMKVLANSFARLAKNNVVHADVKLDNLLIKQTKAGYFTIKVIDFDSSYIADDPPIGDEMQCDFVYMAPETFLTMIEEPAVLSPKVDVFAMGIVFHQLLCGEMPEFDKEYDYVYEAVLNDAELVLHPDIPQNYKTLLTYMLMKEPEDRFSMQQVLAALKDIGMGRDFDPVNIKHTIEEQTQQTNGKWAVADDFD